ncbi:hypothetical protein PUW81_000870 [Microbacterium sp. NM3R9]|uniref:hypothetical protein n=1 Tax=Microbacterium thalli TaxID=3027921 RepID=UPI0023662513|nr:hypothetical protein [Microbacterium thalli]MDN8547651.1 hypothetical protein [Microbacterium thalli]
MNTVVERHPSVAPVASAHAVPPARRLTLTERLALRLALRLIVWSARHRATAAPAVARAREQLAGREARERAWQRSFLLTTHR